MLTRRKAKNLGGVFKRAFTLMESAIVLGIVGIVLGAVWLYSGTVNNRESMEVAVNQVWQIANNVRDLYAGRSNLAVNNGSDMAKHVCASLFPRGMLTGNTNNGCSIVGRPINPWGGTVMLAFSRPTINGAQTAVFDIDFLFTKSAAENRADCVGFLSHFLTSGGGGTATDDQRAGGGPVDSFYRNAGGGWSGSLRNFSPSQISAAMAGGCTGARLRFKL